MYQLIEILSSQYNRKDEVRYNRSMIFCIKNTKNGKIAMIQLDRISKKMRHVVATPDIVVID